MNKQRSANGRGIEWTDYTWNPIRGCRHACQWVMPNGAIANCYAEDVAEGLAQAAYPQGFEHHYWNPTALRQPLGVKQPSRIFVGSMADVFGHWVPDDQIRQVIEMAAQADWHTFQFLTKNPVKAAEFAFSPNCWVGASTPPNFMWNKRLSEHQQERMLDRTLHALKHVADWNYEPTIHWLSAEPLAWNIVPILRQHPGAVQWVVIGAASNGKAYYAPDETHVRRLVDYCDEHGVAVFFKGNLRVLPWAAQNWREQYPTVSDKAISGG